MRGWCNKLFWVVHVLAAPVSATALTVAFLAFAVSLGVN
jgi:hypothetical protein